MTYQQQVTKMYADSWRRNTTPVDVVTVDKPRFSNCVGGRTYKVLPHGKQYRVVNLRAALFIDPRDIKEIK